MIIGVSGKIGSGKDTVGTIIQYLVWRTYYTNKEFPPISERHFEEFRHSLVPDRSDWKIVKYADKLKDCVCIILGCTREELENRVYKETPIGANWIRYGKANGFWSHSDGNPSHKMMDNVPCDRETYEAELKTNWQTAYQFIHTPRTILQQLGTECGRQIHPDIWVNATLSDYKHIPNNSFGNRQPDDTDDIPYEYPNWIITDVRFPNEADAIKQHKGINIRIQKSDSTQFGFEKHLELGDKINSTNEHVSETALDFYQFDYIVNHGTIESLIEQVREILIKEDII